MLAILLSLGSTARIDGALPGGERRGVGEATLAPAALLELVNSTGFAHPAVGAQNGRAQFLVLLFALEVPADNLAGGPAIGAGNAPNEGVEIGNQPATTSNDADRTTAHNDLWRLREQLESIVAGSMGQGTVNGTAATLAKVDDKLLALERTRLRELLAILDGSDPTSAAYAAAIKELIAQRQRLISLSGSRTAAVSEAATAALRELDDRLAEVIGARAPELLAVLRDRSAAPADRAAAASELATLRAALAGLTNTDGIMSDTIGRELAEHYAQRVQELTAVLDDGGARAGDKAAALDELRAIRNVLLGLDSSGPMTGGPRPNPNTDTLVAIEKRLADALRARAQTLLGVLDNASSSDGDKADALAELILLRDELRGLTFGQAARRNEGDPVHDDAITNLGTRIEAEIAKRYEALVTALNGDPNNAATRTAAASELFEAWQRLRALGRTETDLYGRLETTLREVLRREAERLTDTVTDPDASDAARAAAAGALVVLRDRLGTLDATRPGNDGRPYESATYYDVTERLGEYVRERIGKLEGVLDDAEATAAQKAAAIAELEQLRTMLINMGRRPATTGGVGGDAELERIDARLTTVATARLQALTRVLQSSTATTAEKAAALNELEGLRSRFRELSGDHFETLQQIDRLLQQGADGLRQELERKLDGGAAGGVGPGGVGSGGPITGVPTAGTDVAAVNLLEDPDSLASSPASLASFGMPGGPLLAGLVRSTGTSSGPGTMELTIANAGGAGFLDGSGLVVEPLSEDAAARIEELWPQILARANAVVSVTPEGYCLEKEQRPPSAGELFMLASAGKQGRFAPVRAILRAGEDLADAGQLHPEPGSDPQQYYHSIRQWAIWTHERSYDEAAFTEAFVAHTRNNIDAAGFEWTAEVEAQVRGWAPNRFQDLTNLLTAAGLAVAGP